MNTMPGQIKRILLCAAEGKNRDDLATQLSDAGFAVNLFECVDSEAAAESDFREPPNVVLADLANGSDRLRESLPALRNNDALTDTRFIHLLANDVDGETLAADYSLRVPIKDDHLIAIIRAASTESERAQKLRQDVRDRSSAIGTIVRGTFEIQRPTEARNLATMLSLACPEPENAVLGLLELMINGIEHGNLDIGIDDKSKLLARGTWDREIERRLEQPPYRERRLTVNFERNMTSLCVRIIDQGKGFDFAKYLASGLKHSTAAHGRGIFLARAACFSDLHYEDCGNIAVAKIDL